MGKIILQTISPVCPSVIILRIQTIKEQDGFPK
jgi:hypothetical protein